MHNPSASRLKPRLGDCEAALTRSWSPQAPQALSWWPSRRFSDDGHRVAGSLLLLVALAGRAATAQRLTHPTIDTVNHHIVRVRNSGPARWLGTAGWTLVPERTIMADGRAAVIGTPVSLATDSHGNIFETDWKVEGIQEWDRSGKFVRTIGRKGDGPGEFKVPIHIALRGDTILAYMSNQRRVSLWHPDGRLIKEWRVDFCCGGDPRWGTQGAAMVRTALRQNGVDRRGVIRWRPDGTILDTILLPVEAPVHTWDIPHGGSWTIPFSAYQTGLIDSRGWYVGGFGGRYALIMAPHGTDTARIVELPGARPKLSTAVADSVFASYAKISQLAGIAKRGDMPTEVPYFTNLYLDEHDNIWVARFGSDGSVSGFDVIDAAGIFLGSVPVPPGKPGTLLFANGRLFATMENADGEIVIQVYRIDRHGK